MSDYLLLVFPLSQYSFRATEDDVFFDNGACLMAQKVEALLIPSEVVIITIHKYMGLPAILANKVMGGLKCWPHGIAQSCLGDARPPVW